MNIDIEFSVGVLERLMKMSKCRSKQVGCILVKDGRIVSMGYNGTLPKTVNCNDVFCESTFDRDTHHKWSIENEIHAEKNAIAFASKHGIALDGCDAYVSLQPCNPCMLMLLQCGIKRVYFMQYYDKHGGYSQTIDEYVKKNNILVEKIDIYE